jgi:dermatan/chondrotin sulfate uronyl 2-O-sulfotransferase UST
MRKNKTFALQKAKENIRNYYTVVGVVEELYNFLFVLERLLPRYFANIRLAYIVHGRRRVDNTRSKKFANKAPSEATRVALRDALLEEYELYEFIKRRFHAQFQQVLRVSTQ